MVPRSILEKNLFTWSVWDHIDTKLFIFNNVTFLNDFGCFKAGESYHWANINYETGLIQAGNEEPIKQQRFSLTPIE